MRHPAPLSLLSAMRMPLRDALRGVATLADVTEDMLEPAAALLPRPVRASFRSALEALEDAGARLISAPVDVADIATASDVLMGKSDDREGLETTARVIAFAWERLRPHGPGHHQMISETLLTARLGSRGPIPGETPGQRAASLVSDIRLSSAIGRAPGVSGRHSDTEQSDIDLALVSAMVWLLAARTDSSEDEAKLLDLASALVQATGGEIFAAIEEPRHLARQLQMLAAHL